MMSDPGTGTSKTGHCTQCGAELPAAFAGELCPKCLLQGGLACPPPAPEGTKIIDPDGGVQGIPSPGEKLGHYRIIRRLGGGGMGNVLEAEDLETGRRVALKVLSHALDSPEARDRFFREGRLAAGINHPNSVYVFGTEEIGGTPVISMELVPGGTLQDRITANGAMKPAGAVDAILQVIGGLEAAQKAGILHRDVKPSNCFIEPDGNVKIGDFGLSISTAIRTEPALTASGTFLGTPAFCSPEQLRGEELNARSDMYSVGATLFYLLSGSTPFRAGNAVALIATVLEQPIPDVRRTHPEIPRGLAKIVRRCLEKQPGERFKSYEELRRALLPYSSAAPVPATLGLRFVAGGIDLVTLGLVGAAVMIATTGSADFANFVLHPSPKTLWLLAGSMCVALLYYSVSESRWGATAGKFICRLRVVGPGNNPPSFCRAMGRAVIYLVPPILPFWVIFGPDPKAFLRMSDAGQLLISMAQYVVMAILFSTARRRNGFAAIHDLITSTRVWLRPAPFSRPAISDLEPPPAVNEGAGTVGPYHILEALEQTPDAQWLLGYDLRLLRKVWIRTVPPGTPPIAPNLRNLGRVGRLRWLTGVRSAEQNWDAFEAPTGRALLHMVSHQRQPWDLVRFWLADLATELSAAEKDGTLPEVLALDCVWIAADGKAKLLDFPAPGLGLEPVETKANEPPVQTPSIPLACAFLREATVSALAGRVCSGFPGDAEPELPIALHARKFLRQLPQLAGCDVVLTTLRPLLHKPAEISQRRRIAVVAACLAFPLLVGVTSILGARFVGEMNRAHPGVMELNALLQQRGAIKRFPGTRQPPSDNQYGIYIANHYGATITNPAIWAAPYSLAIIKGEARRFAEQSAASFSNAGEADLANAESAVRPFAPKLDEFQLSSGKLPRIVVSFSLGIYVALPAVIAALLFRGGLVQRIAGIAFVRRDGRVASRLRVFWRALVAWSPLAFGLMVFVGLHAHDPLLGEGLAYLVAALPCILSLLLRERGIQDRLAGTWPVPR
jgi:eukaryotic-like serine/threonine-protein kinase